MLKLSPLLQTLKSCLNPCRLLMLYKQQTLLKWKLRMKRQCFPYRMHLSPRMTERQTAFMQMALMTLMNQQPLRH